MRGLKTIIVVMAAAWLCLWTPVQADEASDRSAKENQLKVAFLYNFVKFIQWPGAQALSQTHTATICIAGTNSFGGSLSIFAKASTPQLAFNVRQDVSVADIPSCHILFIGEPEEGSLQGLLAAARAHPVLTVSDIPGFIEEGGIIEMVKTEKNIGLFSKDKINLRINAKRSETMGLRIDPELLEIAAEVIK